MRRLSDNVVNFVQTADYAIWPTIIQFPLLIQATMVAQYEVPDKLVEFEAGRFHRFIISPFGTMKCGSQVIFYNRVGLSYMLTGHQHIHIFGLICCLKRLFH